MFRPRFENLEGRQMLSATNIALDPPVLDPVIVPAEAPPAIVDYIDQDDLQTPTGRTGNNETITIGSRGGVTVAAGDVNGDGRADFSARSNGLGYAVDTVPVDSFSLNFTKVGYNLIINGRGGDDQLDESNLIIVVCAKGANYYHLLPYIEQDNLYKLTDFPDGTSNTLFGSDNGLQDLQASPYDTVAIDVWEHALMDHNSALPIANHSAGLNFAMVDGTVQFLKTDSSGAGEHQASRGIDFNDWSIASQFDRGYLPPALVDRAVAELILDLN